MSQQLPLQIRKDVRDVFEKPNGTIQASFRQLEQVIGYPVSCEPEWSMLWTELESTQLEKSTFIPGIAIIVEAWIESLVRRVEDDNYEAWTETLLEKLKVVSFVKLSILITNEARVGTSWSGDNSSFNILLPKKGTIQASQATSAFAEDFETIFEPENTSNQITQSKIQDDDDWAEVTSNADSRNFVFRTRTVAASEQVPDKLPTLQTLPRPEILFQSTLPYLLHVTSNGASRVTINGTHEPSLRLLAEYLQRWIKTDPEDVRKIPYLRIKLQESKFGLGLLHDSLTIEPFDHHQRNVVVNASLILAFIQGVLGYRPVPGSSSVGYWEFQRSTPFTAS